MKKEKEQERLRTLGLLVLHDVVGDGRVGTTRVPIAHRRRPRQHDRPAALLGHVQITWEIGWFLYQQMDRRLVVAVGVRGDANVVTAVHVARLQDPQLAGDASRRIHGVVDRVPRQGPERKGD